MEELTVTMYQDRYEQLLDIETRVNIIKKMYSENEFIPDDMIRILLGIKPMPRKGADNG